MASLPDQIAEDNTAVMPRMWLKVVRRAAALLLVVLLGLVAYGWTQREKIARDLIGEQLAGLDLPVTYDVSVISTERQVLENIVVGDPVRPDLTIERIDVELAYGFGIPEIGRIIVTKPRLFGSYRKGKLSFGSLDRVLFDNARESTGFPALDIKLVDGRGLIDSEFGPLGLKLEGAGRLDGGFAGTIAAVAPSVTLQQCRMGRSTLYGDLRLEKASIEWSGPIRTAMVDCPQFAAKLGKADAQAQVSLTNDFSAITAKAELAGTRLSASGVAARGLKGDINLKFAENGLVSKFDLTASAISSSQFEANSLRLDGQLRSGKNLAAMELRGSVAGKAITSGAGIGSQLAALSGTAEGTLAQPLLEKLRRAIADEFKGTNLDADFTARQTDGAITLVVPQAVLRNQAGAGLISVSQLQFAQSGTAAPKVSGNFRVDGRNLPKMTGRMERTAGGQSLFRLRMDDYNAGDSRASVPELLVTQNASGAVGFAGSVEASGPLPGGFARGLRVPLNGSWSSTGSLSIWRNCTDVGFDSLAFANLVLTSQKITLCPVRGSAIVRQDERGLKIAAGLANVRIAGSLAGTPMTLKSGPVGFAYPGVATARQLEIALGPKSAASRFVISDLIANFGGDISGSFSGADIDLAAIPLDLRETSGSWNYRDGTLTIEDAAFNLTDRAPEPRFNPMQADGAGLTLQDSVIDAFASLHPAGSERTVTSVAIRHNLSSGSGFADLTVPGLLLDDGLKIDQLTPLAFGVVANVHGVVTGSGRIDWSPNRITSSGEFSSESIDLAAAFGPVKGASGTIRFSDLLNPTTAPNQTIRVASINPGIEVFDGIIGFSLVDGQILGVTGGTWPFMGGTLRLKPTKLNLGIAEKRSYILEVEGLDAGRFVNNLEMENLLATGVFDGTLPIVFDELGNGQIIGGLLEARAPGGNVAYIGQLTYEDLSPIANFAFDTLRSLDYSTMRIEMDGPLTGDILTRIQLGKVKQGEGTKRNFITRQLADLPLQFNVNIRAPFFQLFSSMRSLYDPTALQDPRTLGLIVDGPDIQLPNAKRQDPLPAKPQVPANDNN
ncbi:MAG: YdbH domain-containing protein [Pontixanthobacter sp.]